MTSLEQQPKISVKNFIKKYEDFISRPYGSQDEVLQFLRDFEKLNESDQLPENFKESIKTCQEYIDALKKYKKIS